MGDAVIFYHDPCLDGYASAAIAFHALGGGVQLVPVQYKAGKPVAQEYFDLRGKWAYVLDLSFKSAEHLMSFCKGAKEVVYLDHHQSTFDGFNLSEDFSGMLPWEGTSLFATLRQGQSGAMLTWRHFMGDAIVPRLLKAIDQYDRGETFRGTADPATLEIVKGLLSVKPWGMVSMMSYLLDDDWPKFKSRGEAVLSDLSSRVEEALSRAMPFYTPYVGEGLMANATPDMASALGHEMAKKSDAYGVTWWINKDKTVSLSIRSNDGESALKVARYYGGGGHDNAAGAEISLSVLNNQLLLEA